MTLRISTGLQNGLLDTGSVKSLFGGAGGFTIDVYSGTRPASPNDAATGTKLFTLSVGASKLHFAASAAAGVLAKDASEVWAGTGLATGTAGYYRMTTGADTGATLSTTAIRADGTIATSGADMNMTSTTVALGAPIVVNTATFTFPSA